ncbi:MAG TPA: CBS domain-containing protein [Pyrinomonadaceae bacterium]|jgi:CBS domain-containing protein
MNIREIMTSNPACCTPDSNLQEVARMMRENDCGCIPVVNSMSDMKPVGTITDRDITIRTLGANQNPMNMKASEIMTSDIATVTPEMTLEECFDVMEDREIRRVLVVDERGRCTGIVAQADIVQSGVNPIRTNRVIREISESGPSRGRGANYGGGQNYRSYLSRQALPSGNSLLPLLIGLGSGAALMYLINNRRQTARRSYTGEIHNTYESDFLNAGDAENFGKYVDAEQEIEKRQHDLKERLESARMENNLPADNRTDAFEDDDETVISLEKRRSANQGNT